MPNIEHKAIKIELKTDTPGAFLARIATFNVTDDDGDVTLPGAFPKGKRVLVSAYGHGSWVGKLPVGVAVFGETEEYAFADGQFNLSTETGKEHYETVKFSEELQEWSYGFKVLEQGSEADLDAWAKEHDGARPARILKKLDPFEISPVLKGSGVETETLAIKEETKRAISYQSAHPGGTPKAAEDSEWDAGKEVKEADVDDLKVMCAYVDSSADPDNKTSYKLPHHRAAGKHAVVWRAVRAAMAALMGARGGLSVPSGDRKGIYTHLARHYKEFDKEPPEFHSIEEGMTYADQAETALAAVEDLAARTKSLADLRREEGRNLSEANREKLKELQTSLEVATQELKSLLAATAPVDEEEILKIKAEFARVESEILEVV